MKFQRIHSEVSTPTDVSIASVRNYYRQVSDLAKEASELPVNEREFQCFSLAINASSVSLVKEMMRNFRKQVKKAADHEPNAVFQMNPQFFPLTELPVEISDNVSSSRTSFQAPKQVSHRLIEFLDQPWPHIQDHE